MDFIAKLKKHKNIDLNEQQIEAVNTIDGAILLLAVPGSGKTTVVISRIGNMLYTHKILPEDILTLTFSKAAANDMAERYRKIFGDKYAPNLNFRTIHSFCLEVINNYVSDYNKVKKDILDNPAQIIRSIGKAVTGQFMDDEQLKNIITEISFHKNMLHPDNQFKNDDMPEFAEIYRRYEGYKKEHRLMDYDDMLYNAYFVLTQNKQVLAKYQSRFKYINVDEAQDTSYIQHKIIQLLAVKHNNIFMVGDEDQSIYAFRAAYPKALLDFENNYHNAKTLKIEQNYRSTKSIVNVANIFIKQNKDRVDKNMFCNNDKGSNIKHTILNDIDSQYKYIIEQLKNKPENNSIAILYRNNNSAIPIVELLKDKNIPFYIKDNDLSFSNHILVKDVISYIKLTQNSSDISSFERIYYKINASISKKNLEYIKSVYNSNDNIFDILINIKSLSEYSLMRIIDCKNNILKCNMLTPFQVIEIIEKQLDINWYLENDISLLDFCQKISTLKIMSLKSDKLSNFIDNIYSFDKDIKSNKNISNNITLSTIHSSKGLEFDKVIIIDVIEGLFPSDESIKRLEKNDRTLFEEETRLFYVGITRAKKEIEIINIIKMNNTPTNISIFVTKLINIIVNSDALYNNKNRMSKPEHLKSPSNESDIIYNNKNRMNKTKHLKFLSNRTEITTESPREIKTINNDLIDDLSNWRMILSRKERTAPGNILSMDVIRKIAVILPENIHDLVSIDGFDNSKYGKYKNEIIEIIKTSSTKTTISNR